MLFLFPIMAALQVQAAPSLTGLEIQKVEFGIRSGCRDLGGKLFLFHAFACSLSEVLSCVQIIADRQANAVMDTALRSPVALSARSERQTMLGETLKIAMVLVAA